MCTLQDLAAIGVNKPGHRKKMTSEISKLSAAEWHLDQKPVSTQQAHIHWHMHTYMGTISLVCWDSNSVYQAIRTTRRVTKRKG